MDAIIGRIRYFHFAEEFFDAEGSRDVKLSDVMGLSIDLAKKLAKLIIRPV
jgi:hypothetical protein